MCKNIIENKGYLTELDRAVGDADHGINMSKGFSAVNDKLDEMFQFYKNKVFIRIN